MTGSRRVLGTVGGVASAAVTVTMTLSPAGPADAHPLSPAGPAPVLSVADGQTGVSPIAPVTARAGDGTLRAVTLLNPEGAPVAGLLSADRRSWHTTVPLGYGRTYTLHAVTAAADRTLRFTTLEPSGLTAPMLTPADGETVGIGQPVMIHFDTDIADRSAAQRAVHIATTPAVAGAFYWIGKRDLRWRPEQFWTPGTTVAVDVDDYGRDLGAGVYGRADAHERFTIGPSLVLTADDHTHHVQVSYRGTVIRDMPTSMGKPGTPTPYGVYVVGDRYRSIVMDSRTFGVPVASSGGYRIPVDYATQMSYGGIFMHSAPWSLAQQGKSDASHGCLNLSPADAEWVARHVKRGDVVLVRNTSGPMFSGVDGLGDWNIPWQTWEKGNADG